LEAKPTLSVPAAGQTVSDAARVPRLPTFSGDAKECTFLQWKLEVEGLKVTYPEAVLLQAMRRSVKGLAADVIVQAGNVTSAQLLQKMERVFGNVYPPDVVLQQLYSAVQKKDETAAAWCCRLSNLALMLRGGPFSELTIEEMTRGKFWSGLASADMRNALRPHLEAKIPLDEILVKARVIESESAGTGSSTVAAVQSAMESGMVSKLDQILKRLEKLEAGASKGGKPVVAESGTGSAGEKKFWGKCFRCGQSGHKR
jgi:hypothetical protein